MNFPWQSIYRCGTTTQWAFRVWESRTVWAILAALFCAYAAVGAALPVLPRYVREDLGAGATVVGVVIAASAMATILARPLAGYVAERRGRRPVMLLAALSAYTSFWDLGFSLAGPCLGRSSRP